VLFLDEMPEFDARALENLRQPLEDKIVTITRASGTLTFPANFSLVGGGAGWARPGELSLAHRGVLFLDELPEFGNTMLDLMRQPLEDGVVSLGRARGTIVFPARFMLVGAMNPCPCGYYGDSTRACTCQQGAVERYQKRLSGPLLDRIDLHVEVPRVQYEKLAADTLGESSAIVRARVEAARTRQWARFEGTHAASNAEMGIRELKRFCALDAAGEALLKAAVQRLGLSARAYHRVLKVARTIADLAEAEQIGPAHLAEAKRSTCNIRQPTRSQCHAGIRPVASM